MTVISEEALRQLLDPTAGKSTTVYQHHYGHEGPGRFDAWQHFMEGKEECWLQREANQRQAKKKKILFSNTLLNERAPYDHFELPLISALTQYYDFYLWPGSEVNLAECKPINSSAEFWEKHNLCADATKETIEKSLAQQGLSNEDYIILDYAAYQALLKRSETWMKEQMEYQKRKLYIDQVNDFLDLTKYSGEKTLKNLQTSLGFANIRRMESLLPIADELDLIANLPALEMVKIREAIIPIRWTEGSLAELLSFYRGGIELVDSIFPKELALPETMNQLIINNQEGLNHLILGDRDSESQTEVLRLYSCVTLERLDLENAKKLKKIEIEYALELNIISCSFLPALEELNIKYCNKQFSFDLTKCPGLKRLSITASLSRIQFVSLPELEELTISSFIGYYYDSSYHPKKKSLINLDLSVYPKLRRLVIERGKFASIDFSKLKDLEEIVIEGIENLELDLSSCHQLKRIKIMKCANIILPKAVHLEHLEELELSSCSNIEYLDVSHSDRLKRIDIAMCLVLQKISVKDSQQLENLCIRSNENLREVEMGTHPNLKRVRFSTCNNLTTLPQVKWQNLEELIVMESPQLEKLDVSYCDKIRMIHTSCHSKLYAASHLKKLSFFEFYGLKESDLDQYPQLRTLTMEFFYDTTSLNLSRCIHLEKVTVNRGSDLNELIVDGLLKLKQLTIKDCQSLNRFAVNDAEGLQEISILTCHAVTSLQLTNCQALKSIHLENNGQLSELIVPQPNNIEELEITKCSVFKNLNLADFPKLKRLTIASSIRLNLLDLSQVPDLEELTIKDMLISTFSSLEKLNLNACRHLKKLLIENNNLVFFVPLNLPQLESIELVNVPRIMDLILNKCPQQLKNVKIKSNSTLLDTLDLSNRSELRYLDIDVKEILGRFDLTGCNKLHECYLKVKKIGEIKGLEDCRQLRLLILETADDDFVKSLLPRLPSTCQVIFEKQEVITEHQLSHQNQSSPVSCLSDEMFSESVEVDDETGLPTSPYQAGGHFKVSLSGGHHFTADHYRVMVHDQVELSPSGELRFTTHPYREPIVQNFPTFDPQDVAVFKQLTQQHPEFAVGHIDADIQPGRFYPIVSEQPMERHNFNIYCVPKDAIDLFWNETHQKFEFKLKDNASSQHVEILYLYHENQLYEDYSSEITGQLVKKDRRKLLPAALIDILEKELPLHQALAFLFNNDLALDEKIKLLVDYCKTFRNEDLSRKPQNDIEKKLFSILEQKGSCRHRSEAFMILARFLGVPARRVRNERHAYSELLYYDPALKTHRWYRADFGGAPEVDLTPSSMRQSILTQVASAERPLLPILNRPQMSEEEKEWEEKYFQQFSQLVQQQEIKSLAPLFSETLLLAPLITMKANQDPLTVSQHIISQLKAQDSKSRYLYIHNAADFARYLKPYRLEGGERKQVEGPLEDFIVNGGVLVVNWSQFTPAEIASYKSILDTPPTLLGRPVSNKLKIIGLEKEHTLSCAAFSSRCQRFALHADFFQTLPPDKQAEKKQAPFTIDLFNRLNWREHLLGDIHYDGDEVNLIEGPLVRALHEKRPLVIYNPPDDEDFRVLLQRMRDERKLLYNGEWLDVPDELVIKMESKPHENQLPNVNIEPTVTERKPLYLGLYNIHECYEQLVIDEAGRAHHLPGGWLASYDSSQDIFYLTESIPQSDWQELLAHIAAHHPHTQFHFALAPGIEIENVVVSEALPLQSDRVIVSNDHDYCTLQLFDELKKKGEEAIIIDITPQTSFNNLIAKTRIASQKDLNKVVFSYEEQKVLRALEKGKTVILNGYVNPALYKQLMPLLSSPVYIDSNGQRREVGGKLMIITPELSLPLIQAQEKNYTLSDYASQFSDKEDQLYLKRIEDFYDYAKRLPHRGLGSPDAPILSLQRVIRMMRTLKGKSLHYHNPIKGLFHYDYLRQSEDYAYLNTIAKYLFSEADETALREYKLRKLIDQYKIASIKGLQEHAWKILNCFSGAALHHLLGEAFEAALDLKAGYPTLNQEALTLLWDNIISPRLTDGHEEEKESFKKPLSHVDKRSQQLDALLHDDHTFLIMLKGAPGVGKTHTVRQLKEKAGFAYHEGESAILDWLQDQSDQPIVLLLDEANMASPGTWDFLKGLSRDQRTVYYQNKKYTLSPRHKIIVTGNPEYYPERYYHPLFQHYGETLDFVMPDDDYLEKQVLRDIPSKYAKAMLKAYHLIHDMNPTYIYSNRDLESLAQRFNALLVTVGDESAIQGILYQACVGEFAGTIEAHDKRAQFIIRLAQQFNHDIVAETINENSMITITDKCAIPKEKAYFCEAIQQDLDIRENVLAQPIENRRFYKQGILLEGEGGIGKSTLLKAVLEANGFCEGEKATDPKKRYYEVSAGKESEVYKIVEKAFNEESVVILDEINVDEDLEKLLNQLLTGVDKNGNPLAPEKQRPGFMVFTSENPDTSDYPGRKPLSPALRNRMHMLHMEDYTREGRESIAIHHKIEHPREFATAYERCKRRYKSQVNMRTYYTLCHENEMRFERSADAMLTSEKFRP